MFFSPYNKTGNFIKNRESSNQGPLAQNTEFLWSNTGAILSMITTNQ